MQQHLFHLRSAFHALSTDFDTSSQGDGQKYSYNYPESYQALRNNISIILREREERRGAIVLPLVQPAKAKAPAVRGAIRGRRVCLTYFIHHSLTYFQMSRAVVVVVAPSLELSSAMLRARTATLKWVPRNW